MYVAITLMMMMMIFSSIVSSTNPRTPLVASLLEKEDNGAETPSSLSEFIHDGLHIEKRDTRRYIECYNYGYQMYKSHKRCLNLIWAKHDETCFIGMSTGCNIARIEPSCNMGKTQAYESLNCSSLSWLEEHLFPNKSQKVHAFAHVECCTNCLRGIQYSVEKSCPPKPFYSQFASAIFHECCLNASSNKSVIVTPSTPTTVSTTTTTTTTTPKNNCTSQKCSWLEHSYCYENPNQGAVCICQNGFEKNKFGNVCSDINECNDPQISSNLCGKSNLKCINSVGSFRCEGCKDGFEYNNNTKQCEDIDECKNRKPYPCSTNQKCINTIGSFNCEFCGEGFSYNQTTESCEDIDECVLNTYWCEPGWKCFNEIGAKHTCVQLPSSSSSDEEHSTSKCGVVGVEPDAEGQCPETINSHASDCSTHNCSGIPNSECRMSIHNKPKCSCLSGFSHIVDASGLHCEDIDECTDSSVFLHICSSEHRECQNTKGSFHCTNCLKGFQYDNSSEKCIDIDECKEEDEQNSDDGVNHLCSKNQACVNTIGSYKCKSISLIQCQIGERRDGGQCISVYDCTKQQKKRCDLIENSECKYNNAKYDCWCKSGFEFNNENKTACVDIKECSEDPDFFEDPCTPYHRRCVETPGNYKCTECLDGFEENNVTKECVDIDECARDIHNCSVVEGCQNTIGGYNCLKCEKGFRFDKVSKTCENIDECAEYIDNCSRLHDCIDTEGSYLCKANIHCNTGTQLNEETGTCEDINECLSSIGLKCALMDNRECSNMYGGFSCDCKPGFAIHKTNNKNNKKNNNNDQNEESTYTCEDVDECDPDQGNAKEICAYLHQECINTLGSFQCGECVKGFVKNNLTEKCVDVDECELNTHDCPKQDMCVNTAGSHDCSCDLGGFNIDEKSGKCVDRNECETLFPCTTSQGCKNTLGNYFCYDCPENMKSNGGEDCFCNNGYKPTNKTDGKSGNPKASGCVDINECIEGNTSSLCDTSTHICLNKPGSYECLKCPFGSKPQDGYCVEVNECINNPTICPPEYLCTHVIGRLECTDARCEKGYERVDDDNHTCKQSQKTYSRRKPSMISVYTSSVSSFTKEELPIRVHSQVFYKVKTNIDIKYYTTQPNTTNINNWYLNVSQSKTQIKSELYLMKKLEPGSPTNEIIIDVIGKTTKPRILHRTKFYMYVSEY